MKFEELKTGRKCIEVKSKKELMQIRSYCVYKKLKLDFEVSDFNVEDGHNLFVIFENNLACLFWDKISGDRQKFNISDIDEFNGNFKNLVGKKKLPQIDLRNRVISIEDDEDRDLLFDMLEEQGFVWCNSGEKPREWNSWKTMTKINITMNEIFNGYFKSKSEPFSDILKEYEDKKLLEQQKQFTKSDFTKSDLKDCMIVEYRAGKRRLVVGENLTGKDGHSIVANFKEDLKSKFNEELDIIKIYKSKYVHILTDIFDNKNLELIWERKENTPPKWTDWKPVEYCELFEFRQKDSKIEVRRPSVKGITVSSTCLSTDIFNLKYGQELCIKKWNIEYAKKQLDDFIKEN